MILSDITIEQYARGYDMINPFIADTVQEGVISYGLTHAGYDMRLGHKYKVFKNPHNTPVDPKRMKTDKHYAEKFLEDCSVVNDGDIIVVPAHSYILGYSIEYFKMPRTLSGTCVGKCLAGGTRILNPATGEYKRLDDYRGKTVASVVFGGWLSASTIGEFNIKGGLIHNGRKPTLVVKLRNGAAIKATANHPFMKDSHDGGWTRLDKLRPGDKIVTPGRLPFFGSKNLPSSEVKLLGLMIADGQCKTPGSSPVYTKKDPRLVRMLKATVKKVLGCETSKHGPYGHSIVNHKGRGGTPEKNRASLWLQEHSIAELSRDKMVPDVIFTLPREKVAVFLRVLFSGDGSVYLVNKKRKTPGVLVEYSSASERLIDDLQHLLLRFGVRGMKKAFQVKGDTYYALCIRTKDDVSRFFKEIGFVQGSYKDTFYKESASRYVREPKDAEPIVSEEIVSIEEGLIEDVYDLEVPGPHNFVANNIVVHNSTYARCGIVVNTTPLEPGWEGHLTIEIANVTPCPVHLFAGEGIAQVRFEMLDREPEVDYGQKGVDGRGGKYQGQGPEPVPSRVM